MSHSRNLSCGGKEFSPRVEIHGVEDRVYSELPNNNNKLMRGKDHSLFTVRYHTILADVCISVGRTPAEKDLTVTRYSSYFCI